MRSFMLRFRRMRMDSENDDQSTENSGRSGSEAQESRPEMKLRDLQPEKDPMGAGPKTTPSGNPQ